MIMSKFDKVKKALESKTEGTNNYITLTKNVNAAHGGKYTTKNMITNNTSMISYKTLEEVIKEYELNI